MTRPNEKGKNSQRKLIIRALMLLKEDITLGWCKSKVLFPDGVEVRNLLADQQAELERT